MQITNQKSRQNKKRERRRNVGIARRKRPRQLHPGLAEGDSATGLAETEFATSGANLLIFPNLQWRRWLNGYERDGWSGLQDK